MDDLLKSLHSKIVIKGPLSSSFYLRYGFHRLREKIQNRPNLGHISPLTEKYFTEPGWGKTVKQENSSREKPIIGKNKRGERKIFETMQKIITGKMHNFQPEFTTGNSFVFLSSV